MKGARTRVKSSRLSSISSCQQPGRHIAVHGLAAFHLRLAPPDRVAGGRQFADPIKIGRVEGDAGDQDIVVRVRRYPSRPLGGVGSELRFHITRGESVHCGPTACGSDAFAGTASAPASRKAAKTNPPTTFEPIDRIVSSSEEASPTS